MDEMTPIINEFLTESYENLDQLDQDLVALEANPQEIEILSSIFRTIHTIKGTCGFLGFNKLEGIAHVGENLLSKLRDGAMAMTPQIADALLAMVDAVRQVLGCIEGEDRSEGDVDYTQLIDVLTRLNQGETVDAVPAAAAAAEEAEEAVAASPGPGEILAGENPLPSAAAPEALTTPPEPTNGQSPGNSRAPAGTQPVDNGQPRQGKAVVPSPDEKKAVDRKPTGESNIRVDVKLLDRLMNLVGELVLARNQIVQIATNETDSNIINTTQHLNQLTSELQESVMKTRMQPIGNIWSKYPRVVRDLSVGCGKQVRLEMEGKETELDKTLIEAIKDPLTHIVRNSVDHGIEMPEVREAAGKPAEGCLSLRAYHEGGQVNIEIVDDGGGIDPERIKKKALEKSVITPDQAARMNDRELVNLVFAPGFSTAEKVSNISGRGVGMDVVRTNIEKIGGKIDLTSTVGAGTNLKIKIPLTLAIIPALTITCGGGRFCIPQVSLLELVRLDPERAEQEVERIQGHPVYRLRGKLLPLVFLNKELGLMDKAGGDTGPINIVVLQADNRQFGLVVDRILDTEEIVVKPLGKQLKGITAYSGATIMGDGKVALILDVMGLAQKARLVADESRDSARGAGAGKDESRAGERKSLLVFTAGGQNNMAVPLSLVTRLEEFKWSTVERSGADDVVQYRGEIMPLIHLSQVLKGTPREPDDNLLEAIIFSNEGRSVGVVVDHIIDIFEENIVIKSVVGRKGILGSAVVQGKVTDLLDVRSVIEETDPGFYSAESAGALTGAR